MRRELKGHKVNGANDGLKVLVLDEPGCGGACHKYRIDGALPSCEINFQNGPIKEAGVNANASHESLLSILIDRMEGFQSGKFASSDNEQALIHLRAAQEALLRRTKARVARGVEGTHTI